MRTIDEVIDELKRTTGFKKYNKAVVRLDLMPDVLHYLIEYRDSQKMTRTECLIDVLREVRGEK